MLTRADFLKNIPTIFKKTMLKSFVLDILYFKNIFLLFLYSNFVKNNVKFVEAIDTSKHSLGQATKELAN